MYSLIKEITFKVSSYCNLMCAYCFQTQDIKERNDVFNDFDALTKFLVTIPTRDHLEVKMTGGEVSLFGKEIRYAVKQLRRVERKKDLILRPTVITNGTQMDCILELLDDGVLYPHGTKVSWDGIYSASKARKPKNPAYDDAHFRRQIELVGKSRWKRDILIRTAVTEESVDDLYESLVFALDAGCEKWEYYFISDYDAYNNREFVERFTKQIGMIAEEYEKRFQDPGKRWTYGNWDSLYFARTMTNPDVKSRAVSCRHLGRGLYIAYDGRIFPCGYFDSFSKYRIGGEIGEPVEHTLGTIYDGFDKEAVAKFVAEYLRPPMCDYSTCQNTHCFECPAANKKMRGTLNAKHCRTCAMLSAERAIFEKVSSCMDSTILRDTLDGRFSFMQSWDFEEYHPDGCHQLPMRGELHV